MAVFTIKKGVDIPLVGKPENELLNSPDINMVALKPSDFPGVRPKMTVQVGDRVKIGQELFHSKNFPEIKFRSPGGGVIHEIERGHRRAIMAIKVALDESEEWEKFETWDDARVASATGDSIREHILEGGIWPFFRQRPLAKMARPDRLPKAIYINGMDTEPLAANQNLFLKDKKDDFAFGIKILKKLTEGKVYLSLKHGENAGEVYPSLDGVDVHHFKGPHPAGLVGLHILKIDPIAPSETVWYLRAVDVLAIADFFKNGLFPTQRMVALSGSGFTERKHYMVRLGASVADLAKGRVGDGNYRFLSGSVLSGTEIDENGFVGFYDTTITAIPDSNKRELFGWGMPGWKKYSLCRAFASSLIPGRKYDLDTRLRGGVRPIVNVGAWDKVFPYDIHLSYLIRAILIEDLEEAESLGLLEIAEEDVALCTFACPSKMELGEIVRQGLDLYEKESF